MLLSFVQDALRRKYIVGALAIVTTLWLLYTFHTPPPIIDVKYGRVKDLQADSHFAIATFLSGQKDADPEAADYYFDAVRVLTYQLVHDEKTRIRNKKHVSFIVLVTKDVPLQKQQQLGKEGALVVPVDDIPLNWWISTGVTRWKDQFTKLRLFQMVEFSRILFIDADTFLTGPLDEIFDEPFTVRQPVRTKFELEHQLKGDEAPLPASYVFCARSDNALTGEREHPFPPAKTSIFSAGFWLAAPSLELFDVFVSVMQHYRRFDPHTMEQSLLNYVFRREGAMPWTELDYRWSATWPSEKDLDGGVVSLHEKLGMTGPEKLKKMWYDKWSDMDTFYKSRPVEEEFKMPSKSDIM
ncbi:glycosyltransferase family 8 protein [Aplosporella prunicola CBS 121167]|uniref:Glycosyltransferase family 8 protein n=1 Tax=Aplosporella prunicola CBS 121167 TaxID=1176127 RepID=A0A6A6AXI5_9PEZI|nr:glycosyltransferase family 8 protein [Aplosporella prunicola CBS 121167]KAF2136649.1 glycosyltransferase family 8 protein [Aplosporella prunicola CBS 121167]